MQFLQFCRRQKLICTNPRREHNKLILNVILLILFLITKITILHYAIVFVILKTKEQLVRF